MIPRIAVTLGALVAAFASGCAITTWQTDESQPVTPSSYSAYQSPTPRTIGKLRRILLVNTASPTPEACRAGETTAPPGVGKDYLQEEKGYEVTELGEPGDSFSETEKSAILQLAAAAEQTHKPVSAPTAVRQLASPDRRFDALMLVEAGWSCAYAAPAYRWPMAVMSLGIFEVMPPPELRSLARHYRATLFEAATGRPVWQTTVQHAWRIGNFAWVNDPIELQLFREIEQAVPALLIR